MIYWVLFCNFLITNDCGVVFGRQVLEVRIFSPRPIVPYPDQSLTNYPARPLNFIVRPDYGNFAVTVRPSDGVIERNVHFSLEVSLQIANGDADADSGVTKVTVDADMPAHRHGMNTQPEITEEGNHRYRVDGMVFHMAGDWVITVDIARGNESERASFPVFVE